MTAKKDQISVLFVCTGNICRSPTAEGIFRQLVEEADLTHKVRVDSAGMIAFHTGESLDPRSQEAAQNRGFDLSDIRARQINNQDYHEFDHLIALDRSHLDQMLDQAPENSAAQIRLLMDFAPNLDIEDVPDPYYEGSDGFENVLDLITSASAGLLLKLREELNIPS